LNLREPSSSSRANHPPRRALPSISWALRFDGPRSLGIVGHLPLGSASSYSPVRSRPLVQVAGSQQWSRTSNSEHAGLSIPVNRRPKGTPYRRAKGTPLRGEWRLSR
jgi:hypothetical protein